MHYASLAFGPNTLTELCGINYDLMECFQPSPSQRQLLLRLNGLPTNIRPINFKIVKARFCLPSPDADLTFFVNIQVSNTFQLGFRLQLIINEPFEIVPFDLNLEVVPVSYLNFSLRGCLKTKQK